MRPSPGRPVGHRTARCPGASCRELDQAVGFGPDGLLVRLQAWDGGEGNYRVVVTDRADRQLWVSPVQAHGRLSGYERFYRDGRDRLYLTTTDPRGGQALSVLAWRDGRLQDAGSFTAPLLRADQAVFPEDRDGDGVADLVAHSASGLVEPTAGALVESVYTPGPAGPRLTGCRQREHETLDWTAFAPGRDGCRPS